MDAGNNAMDLGLTAVWFDGGDPNYNQGEDDRILADFKLNQGSEFLADGMSAEAATAFAASVALYTSAIRKNHNAAWWYDLAGANFGYAYGKYGSAYNRIVAAFKTGWCD